MSNHVLNINTILHTKDGSKIGNAIVTGRTVSFWEVTTDYGNKVCLTTEGIEKLFTIGWSNYTKEIQGYDCQEMQEMMSSDHKYRYVGSGGYNPSHVHLDDSIVVSDNGIHEGKVHTITYRGLGIKTPEGNKFVKWCNVHLL